MKIVFVSNFINHHQVNVADELYKLCQGQYWFIETNPISEALINSGYPVFSRPYLIKTYDGMDKMQYAKKTIDEADVVVIGDAPESLVDSRILNNKLTFRYSERWFKSRPWFLTGPRGWVNFYKNHIRHRNKPLYMLCASAYTAKDVNAIGAYKNKCFKWGYFTNVAELDISTIRSKTLIACNKVHIMWCARFLKWKHPELPIKLAAKLKDKGYNFVIDMFGSGDELLKIKKLVKSLKVEEYINFRGNLPNDIILNEMRRHHIFLFTSDRNEGWGAVLNEAMSSGCAVVGSDKIGAVPYLIEDYKNGLIFKSGNLKSLTQKVALLLDHPKLIEALSIEAYNTMRDLWSPQNAARSFLSLVEALNTKDCSKIPMNGPCSITR